MPLKAIDSFVLLHAGFAILVEFALRRNVLAAATRCWAVHPIYSQYNIAWLLRGCILRNTKDTNMDPDLRRGRYNNYGTSCGR